MRAITMTTFAPFWRYRRSLSNRSRRDHATALAIAIIAGLIFSLPLVLPALLALFEKRKS